MKKILFDATVLVDGEDLVEERRGIYFVAKKILENMSQYSNVKIELFATTFKIAGLERVKKTLNLEMPLYRKVMKFDEFLYVLVTAARKRRMKNFTRPLVRKWFALWVLVFNIIGMLLYSVYNLFCENPDDSVFFSARTSAPWYIRKNQKIKKFVILYDLIPYILPEYANQKKWGWFGYLIRTLNKKDFYFAISQTTKDDFCDFSRAVRPDHVSVCHLAADENFRPNQNADLTKKTKMQYAIPLDKKYIFSLCTLEPRKNLNRIIRSFILFLKKNNITDLIFVVGGGEWNNFKRALQKDSSISDCFEKYVVHIGYVKDQDLPILYSGALWFVFTSQYEGFGLPPLEAMQCGCPVITSNTSSLPEVVGDAGLMIDWDSDEQHVAAYEKYYFDENIRNEYAQKSLERAKTFSWKKTIDTILKKMREVSGVV